MGKLEKQVLGKIRGKVGDVMFRITNGMAIVSACPTKRALSNDPEAVKRRNHFSITVKFAHAVNYLSPLKHFWKSIIISSNAGFRSALNKIVKENYSRVSDSDVLSTAMLVPDIGFQIHPTNTTLSNSEISVTLGVIGNDKGIDTGVETQLQLASVVFLKTPVGDSSKPVAFLHRLSAAIPVNLATPVTFTIPLDNIESQIFDAYSSSKGLFALVTLDADNVPVRYSNTFQSV